KVITQWMLAPFSVPTRAQAGTSYSPVGTCPQAIGGVQMSRQYLLRTACIIAAMLLSTAVFAQSGQVEGTVKIKAADGSLKPAPGIKVDIYRLDIKGHFEVLTDKNGHYVRLGL